MTGEGAARGAVILCDHLYPTKFGKWVIAGTYTTWWTAEAQLEFRNGLQAYLRFQVEQPGSHRLRLQLVNRHLPANEPPIHRIELAVQHSSPFQPCELGVTIPPFGIRSPVPPAEIPTERPVAVHLSVDLEVDDTDLASSPLVVLFRNPKARPPESASEERR